MYWENDMLETKGDGWNQHHCGWFRELTADQQRPSVSINRCPKMGWENDADRPRHHLHLWVALLIEWSIGNQLNSNWNWEKEEEKSYCRKTAPTRTTNMFVICAIQPIVRIPVGIAAGEAKRIWEKSEMRMIRERERGIRHSLSMNLDSNVHGMTLTLK